MKSIKFRAKKINTQDWAYGYYVHYDDILDNADDCDYIVEKHDGEKFPFIKIDIKTLGQYTGLRDAANKPIFEGDIIQMRDRLVQVVWHEKAACWDCNFITYTDVPDTDFSIKGLGKTPWWKMYEVVGNIYDNKDIVGD